MDVIEMARQDYDSWLNRVNAELKKQGMKEIPYRQGYFPHFTEPKQNFIQKLLNWKTQGTTPLFLPRNFPQVFPPQSTGICGKEADIYKLYARSFFVY